MYEYDEYDDLLDPDEMDLLELVSSDTKSSNQYLVFVGSDDEVFGINVSKIKELMVFKDLNQVKNTQIGSLIRSTADIRDNMTTIINFDEWFGNEVLKDSEYELVILTGFGGHHLGIMVKNVEYIVNINPQNMQDNSLNNPKTNFIAKIKLNGQERLCTIFDSDKMLLDIFEEQTKTTVVDEKILHGSLYHEKQVFFADDSRFIRKMVKGLFDSLELKYQIFENGLELIEVLENTDPNTIGLIITDLEMPVMDGYSVIKKIRENRAFDDINVIVHTNMSNDIMETSLNSIGANDVIAKINMPKLSEAIKEYFR